MWSFSYLLHLRLSCCRGDEPSHTCLTTSCHHFLCPSSKQNLENLDCCCKCFLSLRVTHACIIIASVAALQQESPCLQETDPRLVSGTNLQHAVSDFTGVFNVPEKRGYELPSSLFVFESNWVQLEIIQDLTTVPRTVFITDSKSIVLWHTHTHSWSDDVKCFWTVSFWEKCFVFHSTDDQCEACQLGPVV